VPATPSPALEKVSAARGKPADSVVAVAADADVDITMPPDSLHLQQMILGAGGCPSRPSRAAADRREH
jgi:3-hydroxyisobutyrate dehydrogenase-like beta-hydroxyacid dehydrogenase